MCSMHTLTREARGVGEARSAEPTPRGGSVPTPGVWWSFTHRWLCGGASLTAGYVVELNPNKISALRWRSIY